MNHDELVGIFKYGLTRLNVDANGLTPDNDIQDLNVIAALAATIKNTTPGDTLHDLQLYRLACLTEDLLVSPWLHYPGITKDWLIARGELLQLQIPEA